MKLKQRVIVTGSLFITMVTLFMIGIHLSWPGADIQKDDYTQSKEKAPATHREPPPSLSSQRNVIKRERDVPPKPPNFDDLVLAKNMLRNHALRSPLSNMSHPWLRHRPNRTSLMRGPPIDEVLRKPPSLVHENLPDFIREKIRKLPSFDVNSLPDNVREEMRKPPSLDSIPDFVREKLAHLKQEEKTPPPSPSPVNAVSSRVADIPDEIAKRSPWEIWREWVEPNYLYPEDAFWSPEMNHILQSMATVPVTQFGVGHKGTQLKATLMLGKQRTVFKPQRYQRDTVLAGEPYVGYDRHNGEIAGFHLDGILGFRIAPPVVGRRLNLTAIRPVTTEMLLSTYVNKDGNTCFYGKCYYCRPDDLACASGDIMEGSVTLWLPAWYELKTRRHPYQRTYKNGVKAKWETDKSYCRHLLKPSSEYYHGILELTDSAVFDFLMGNADRHHYETYSRAKKHGRIMHIDNGKTFGNPNHDEKSILAPLSQCCRLRASTWETLMFYYQSSDESLSEVLDRSLRRDPIWPILSDDHLKAIDRRLKIIVDVVNQCITKHGKDTAIVKTWG